MPWHASLRWRLTLLFVGLLAALLVLAGGAEYLAVRQSLVQNRAQSLRADFAVAERLLRHADALRRARGASPLPLRAAAAAFAHAGGAAGVSTVIFGPGLQLLVEVPGRGGPTGRLPLLPARVLAAAAGGRGSGPILLGSGTAAELAVALPLHRAGPGAAVVQLSLPARTMEQDLRTIGLLLGVGGVATVLLALALGLTFSGRALRPLRRLTATAAALGQGDLSQRSRLPPRRDEVGVLAGVFDEMAASVERTVQLREEAERQMRQFIGDASHELRTPLTALKGYLDVLRRGAVRDPAAVATALPSMAAEAERMRQLVESLLILARADAHRALTPRPLQLDQIVAAFLDGRPAGGTVTRDLNPGCVALADPDAVLTILTNLATNASRYAPGAPVSWRTWRQGAEVGLSCADRGPGIDPEDLSHLFERFYRADRARSRVAGGSGLGLAIVHALAEAQGGRVTVRSQPGAGATFTVFLPAAPGP